MIKSDYLWSLSILKIQTMSYCTAIENMQSDEKKAGVELQNLKPR